MNNGAIRAMRWTLIGGVLIMAVKFAAFFFTRSNAILTDALESIINIAAGSFTLFSLSIAARPQDENHPYGHGKIEYFAAGFEGGLIVIAGIAIFAKAIEGLIHPKNLVSLDLGIALVAATGLANALMGVFLTRIGKKEGSYSVQADGKHLISDAVSSVGLLAGLGVVWFTEKYWLDSVISGLMAVVISYTGFKLIRHSVSGLMDEADLQTLDQIVKTLNANRKPEWIDVHFLRAQRHGALIHIDCHVTIAFYYRFDAAFEIYQAIEDCIQKELGPNVEICIHAEPCTPAVSCCICSVPNCDFRTNEKSRLIQWEVANLTTNKPHTLSDSAN